MKKTLFFCVGISGSGKSYYLKNKFLNDFPEVIKFLNDTNIILNDIIVSPDSIRKEVCGDVSDISKDGYVWKLAKTRLKETLDKYGYGVFDATGVSGKGRNSFLKNFKNISKIAIIFEPNVELAKERIKNDLNEGVDRSKVPMFVVDRQFKAFKCLLLKMKIGMVFGINQLEKK